MWNKRRLLAVPGLSAVAAAIAALSRSTSARPTETFPVAFEDAEWRRRLTSAQFNILRGKSTERPFTSPLNAEHRRGTFACAGCGTDLYASETKFDSGTGWPSFYAPLDGAVGTSRDFGLGLPRTEVHCHACGGHLGHVFSDGPKPTGLRYCMNGVAMTFKSA